MKKIIIITRSMQSGGAERVIAQLANYFSEQSIRCKIVTLEKGPDWYTLPADTERISVGQQSENKLLDKLKTYSRIRRIVKKERPDVVLSMPEEVGVYVILALLGTGIRVVVSERNNPWVMPDVKITRILRKLMYPFVDGLVFQTEMARSFFSDKIQRKGTVIPNPVDGSRIPAPYKGQREKVIVGAGRLEKQKNFQMLISAFAEFCKTEPDYRLIIYGEGSLRGELEAQIAALRLGDRVFLPGKASDLPERMNPAAMFVLSSDYEGSPNVLIEAMCMGMPVISTDCPSGGPAELIRDGVDGFLIPVGDQAAMARKMEILTDSQTADRLGGEALKLRSVLTDNTVFLAWEKYLFQGEKETTLHGSSEQI